MKTKLSMIAALMIGAFALSGCVPLAVGAGGAVVADTVAEDNGGNLF